jgi:hypothetical protein
MVGVPALQQRPAIPDLSLELVKAFTLLFKTDFYALLPFAELNWKKHQVRCGKDGRRRQAAIRSLWRLPAPFNQKPILSLQSLRNV